ncbi:YheC/YheD family protein [Bacillus sp. FJAT-49736]|uniref:YheC/YheD family protein n=1 Tax=Bacillus sp. FJAT-49736 TaxID=2833582 RepID=UPI001BCA1842|nr:YheC/YheD family protein [Bacillus sp. FJAT-49736]MBS4173954.1 YheC/YheD family protein [Bacillus sp. FJAT-49736]
MSIGRRQIKSKAVMFYVLQCHPETKIFLPPTEILEYHTLGKMTKAYKKIYVKPDQGSKSNGIIRIEKKENGSFLLRTSESETIEEFRNFHKLWSRLKDMTSNSRYIVQKGIENATIDQRNFDIRAHVLRVNGEWTIGGICCRLGAPGNIVTTSLIGGKPITLETLFAELLHYSEEDQQQVLENLHHCILNTARKISPLFPKNKEFGIDIGLDGNKQVWLYEVNTAPLIRANFRLLADKTLYQRIMRLKQMAE